MRKSKQSGSGFCQKMFSCLIIFFFEKQLVTRACESECHQVLYLLIKTTTSLRNMSDNLVDKNNIIQCGKDLN